MKSLTSPSWHFVAVNRKFLDSRLAWDGEVPFIRWASRLFFPTLRESMNENETRAGLAVTPGYVYARRVGDQLFVAGQVPHDPEGQIVGLNDSCSQAAQCLNNLNTLLSVHGFSASDIQRIVIYVVGEPEQLARAWSGVVQWFSGRVPPATLLGVASLGHNGQLVEVDATVVKDAALARTSDT